MRALNRFLAVMLVAPALSPSLSGCGGVVARAPCPAASAPVATVPAPAREPPAASQAFADEGPPVAFRNGERRRKLAFTHFPGADIDAVGVRQETLQRYALSSAVLFAFDDDRLSAEAPTALDEALRSCRARPTARVTVVGHADSVRTGKYNLVLSQRRARSVAEYLVQKGVAADRLRVRGAGADEPVAPNDTEEHRRQNRRVEITVDGR